MDEEMVTLDENATWDLVQLPKAKKPIGCKWVYKVKHIDDDIVRRHKARLIAKAYAQAYRISFEKKFNLIAKMTTKQAVIALAASKGWVLHQMDVKNVFLHGDLQEEVYMDQPPSYEDLDNPNRV